MTRTNEFEDIIRNNTPRTPNSEDESGSDHSLEKKETISENMMGGLRDYIIPRYTNPNNSRIDDQIKDIIDGIKPFRFLNLDAYTIKDRDRDEIRNRRADRYTRSLTDILNEEYSNNNRDRDILRTVYTSRHNLDNNIHNPPNNENELFREYIPRPNLYNINEFRYENIYKNLLEELNPLTTEQKRLLEIFGIRPLSNTTSQETAFLISEAERNRNACITYLKLAKELPEICKAIGSENFAEALDDIARTEFNKKHNTIALTLNAEDISNILQMRLSDGAKKHIVSIYEGKPAEIPVTADKSYVTIPISGLKKKTDVFIATEMLIYGLIGKNKEKVTMSAEYFEKNKLQAARALISASKDTQEKIFDSIKEQIIGLKSKDVNAKDNILNYFDMLQNHEISDLVQGIRSIESTTPVFSHLEFKIQSGTRSDLESNSRLMACTFLPKGLYKEASFIYYADPDVTLMHAVPLTFDKKYDPIGVAIMINAHDSEGRSYVLVDSVEGGSELERIKEQIWAEGFYKSILNYAKDIGKTGVFFNNKSYNSRPRAFLEYVRKRQGLEPVELNLTKDGMIDYSELKLDSHASREAFETWGEDGRTGKATGLLVYLK